MFWRLTPREFGLLRDGFNRREDRAWEKVATLGLWILAPWSKQQHTVLSLLGRAALVTLPPPAPATPLVDDPEALEREKAARVARTIAWAKGA